MTKSSVIATTTHFNIKVKKPKPNIFNKYSQNSFSIMRHGVMEPKIPLFPYMEIMSIPSQLENKRREKKKLKQPEGWQLSNHKYVDFPSSIMF